MGSGQDPTLDMRPHCHRCVRGLAFLWGAGVSQCLIELLHVQGELNWVGCRLGPQVIHPCLQTLWKQLSIFTLLHLPHFSRGCGAEIPPSFSYQLPAVEVHAAQLAVVWLSNVDVEGLTLVDEGSAVGRHLEHGLLGDLPHRLVQVFQVLRDPCNAL